MLNIIASYNELLYAITNTMYKISTTSMINFAKLTILKIRLFQSIKNFEYRFCDVNYNFVEVNCKFVSQFRKNNQVNNNFVPLCRKFCEVYYNFVSQCQKFCEVYYNFVSQCQKFCEVNYNFVSQRRNFERCISILFHSVENFKS